MKVSQGKHTEPYRTLHSQPNLPRKRQGGCRLEQVSIVD